MIRIILACQHGASTDLLAVKMEEAAKAVDEDVEIHAYSYTKLEHVIDDADVVLLGPQVRYKLKSLQAQFADKNAEFMVVDPSDYGLLNGEKVLKEVVAKVKSKRGTV